MAGEKGGGNCYEREHSWSAWKHTLYQLEFIHKNILFHQRIRNKRNLCVSQKFSVTVKKEKYSKASLVFLTMNGFKSGAAGTNQRSHWQRRVVGCSSRVAQKQDLNIGKPIDSIQQWKRMRTNSERKKHFRRLPTNKPKNRGESRFLFYIYQIDTRNSLEKLIFHGNWGVAPCGPSSSVDWPFLASIKNIQFSWGI